MYVDSGDWYTDPYKRFGIYVDNNRAQVNVWAGKNGLGGANLSGNFTPKSDTTYSLMMAILPNGEFLGVIWNPSDPSKTIYYREKIGKNWSNLTWTFKIGADSGTILFDNFREIKFADSGGFCGFTVFARTIHEFFTNKRTLARKFEHSWPIRGRFAT